MRNFVPFVQMLGLNQLGVLEDKIMQQFKQISIRGRLAFGAKCIESYLGQYNIMHRLLNKVLDVIWEFTTSNQLDKWDEKVNDFIPDSVLDNHPQNVPEEYPFLKKEEFFELKKLYQELPNDLIKLIQHTIEIGISNLYGGTGHYSAITLEHTIQVYEVARKSLDELPDVNKFLVSTFDEYHGWGNNIDRKRFD